MSRGERRHLIERLSEVHSVELDTPRTHVLDEALEIAQHARKLHAPRLHWW